MKIHFFTRSTAKGKNSASIRVFLRDGDKRLYAKTPLKIPVKYWNDDAKASRDKVRDYTEFLERDWYKDKLVELETELNTQFLKIEQEPTSEWLQGAINDFFRPPQEEKPESMFEFIKNFIEASPNRINQNTGKYIAKSTIKKYNTCYNLLKEYARYKGKPELNFDEINMDFYDGFTGFLAKKKDHAKNTIGKQIAVLKVFMKRAQRKGLHNNTEYTNSTDFKITTEESDSVYLDEKELDQLYKLDFSKNKKLEKVRDLFLVGAWTGCRFSDFGSIKPENISNGFISIEQAKTGERVKIPLHPIVKELLDKYEGKLPRPISNQKFNEYIKDVAQAENAGLDAVIITRQTKGGNRVVSKSKKHELISSHTARRSFATNLYKSGFPTIGIMKMTGHRTEKAFLKYIKVTDDEHAEMLARHWANWERS